ncbi:hypothetical protein SPRG_09453 [Saprolegnia parasitica CBS 223.65]|uniref:Uncharacterized protein n=1 Tax=Saprolegnia parasitica (strain CBS 223.65) TaxID=695850 RepID=A0A067C3X0_SAPPC|nr:hypothetical protein SPRG_09453 [Saprolegnia parasitica CBS 223.65]KDO25178.1 hypothetical protein SPRG_09453 [Saprolegnia parasitica CBS 223.65]|eukprot:XP_012204044.1 hypothetical protein SPRG_09453 [Saprolegnia parasitica CBS 223.65]
MQASRVLLAIAAVLAVAVSGANANEEKAALRGASPDDVETDGVGTERLCGDCIRHWRPCCANHQCDSFKEFLTTRSRSNRCNARQDGVPTAISRAISENLIALLLFAHTMQLHRLGLGLSLLLVSAGACSWEATTRHVASNVSFECPNVAPGMHLTPTRAGEPMVWSEAGDAFEMRLLNAAGVAVDAPTHPGDYTVVLACQRSLNCSLSWGLQWSPSTRALSTCPIPGVYKEGAMGFRLELTSAGAFALTAPISSTTCSVTGQYTESDQTITLTVATASPECGSLIAPKMQVSTFIAFASDCQKVTIQFAGSFMSLQRSSASSLPLSALLMALAMAMLH